MTGGKYNIDIITNSVKSLSAEETAGLLVKQGYNAEIAKQILMNKDLSAEEAKLLLEQTAQTGSTFTLAGAYEGLAASIGLTAAELTTLLGVAGAVAIGIFAVYENQKKFAESTKQLGEDIKNLKSDMSDYKKQISDYYDVLNDSTKSYDEQREARERLLEIQKELIDQYGEEASAIDLINNKYNDSIINNKDASQVGYNIIPTKKISVDSNNIKEFSESVNDAKKEVVELGHEFDELQPEKSPIFDRNAIRNQIDFENYDTTMHQYIVEKPRTFLDELNDFVENYEFQSPELPFDKEDIEKAKKTVSDFYDGIEFDGATISKDVSENYAKTLQDGLEDARLQNELNDIISNSNYILSESLNLDEAINNIKSQLSEVWNGNEMLDYYIAKALQNALNNVEISTAPISDIAYENYRNNLAEDIKDAKLNEEVAKYISDGMSEGIEEATEFGVEDGAIKGAESAKQQIQEILKDLDLTSGEEAAYSVIDELENAEYDKLIRDFNTGKNDGFWQNVGNNIANFVGGYTDNLDRAIDKINNVNTSIVNGFSLAGSEEAQKELLEFQKKLSSFKGVNGTDLVMLDGDVYQVTEDLKRLKRYISENFGDSNEVASYLNEIDKAIAQQESTIENYGDVWDQYILHNKILSDEGIESGAADLYRGLTQAITKYQDAIANGNQEAAQNAADTYGQALTSAMQQWQDDKNMLPVLSYLKNLAPELQYEIDQWNLVAKLQIETDDGRQVYSEVEKTVAGYINQLSSDYTIDDLIFSANSGIELKDATTEQKIAFDNLKRAAEIEGVNFDTYLKILNGYNNVHLRTQTDLDFSKNIDSTNMNGLGEASIEREYDMLTQYTKDFDEKQKEMWLNVTNETMNATEKIKAYEKAQESAANATQINPFSFENTSTITDAISKVQEVYGKAKEATQNGKFKGIDISEIESLRDEFTNAEKGIGLSTEAFEKWEKVLSTAGSSAEDVKSAMNDIATEIVNAKLATGEMTAADRDLMISQLELAGVTKESASAWVDNAIEINKIDEAAQRGVISQQALTDAAKGNISALLSEGQAAGFDAKALLQYALEKGGANGLSIDTNLDGLISECEQLGLNIALLQEYKALKGLSGGQTSGTHRLGAGDYTPNGSIKSSKDAVDDIREQLKDINKLDIKLPDVKGAGGAAKDAAKDVDKLADAYNNLYEIVQTYNENGEISIEQAEQLASMDLRYIALLSEQGDKMTINQAAVDSLTASKRELLKVELYQNALDTLSAINSEAEAMQFLAQMTNEATGAQLGLLKAKVATMAADKFKNQPGAVDQIMASLAAAEKMIDASVMKPKNSKDTGGNDKNNKENDEPEKEDFEEEFNWIERLLNKLSKHTEKISKTIENLYSFQKKNYYINKGIKSIDREISAQQAAYKYYYDEAEKINIDRSLKNKVKNGEVDIQIFNAQNSTKENVDNLKKYIDLYDAAMDCKDAIDDLYKSQRDLIRQKLDNVLDYYEDLDSYLSSIAGKIDSILNLNDAKGKRTSIAELAQQFEAYKDQIDLSIGSQEDIKRITTKVTYGVDAETADDIVNKWLGTDKETVSQRLQDELNSLNSSDGVKNTGIYKNIESQISKQRDKLEEAIRKGNQKTIDKIAKQITVFEDQLSALENNATENNAATYLDAYKKFQALQSKLDPETAAQNKKYNSLKDTLEKYNKQNEIERIEKELEELKKNTTEGSLIQDKINQYTNEAIGTETYKQVESKLEKAKTAYEAFLSKNKLSQQANGEISDSDYDKLSASNKKKYKQLLLTYQGYENERNAIANNANADIVTNYAATYEAINKLETKLALNGKLSSSENQRLSALKNTLEQYNQQHQKELQTMIQDMNIANAQGQEEMIQATYEQELSQMNNSYQSELNNLYGDVRGTAQYQKLKGQLDTLIQKRNSGKKLSTSDETKIANLTKELEALEKGASSTNITDFIKTYDKYIKLKNKVDSGKTLSASEAKSFDDLKAKLDAWQNEKQEEIKRITDEWNDAIQNLATRKEGDSADAITKYNESLAKAYEVAKMVAEYRVSVLQDEISSLEAQISYAQNLIGLYDKMGEVQLRNLGYLKDEMSLEEAYTNNYEKATNTLSLKLEKQKALRDEYESLINSLDTDDIESSLQIFERLKNEKDFSESTKESIQTVIDFLDARAVEANDWAESADLWEKAWSDAFYNVQSDLVSTTLELQELKDSFRDWELSGLNKAIEQLESAKNTVASLVGLLDDDWLYDKNGITEFGLSKVKLLTQELGNAQQEVSKYAEIYNKILATADDGSTSDSFASPEEKQRALNEAQANYYNALTSTRDIEKEIYEIAKKAQEEEINNLSKLVDKYKDALSAKKALYDYDKNLKNSQKAVESLEAQLQAINNVNTAEANAKRAQLEAQLKDAQDALKETEDNHQYEMIQNALDDLVKSLQDALDSSAKSIDETFEHFAKTLEDIIGTSSNADVNTVLGKVTDLLLKDYVGIIADKVAATPIEASVGAATEGATYSVIDTTNVDSLSSNIQKIFEIQNKLSDNINSSVKSSLSKMDEMIDSLKNIEINTDVIRDAVVNNNITLSYDKMLEVGSVDIPELKEVLDQSYKTTVKNLSSQLKKLGYNI